MWTRSQVGDAGHVFAGVEDLDVIAMQQYLVDDVDRLRHVR